MRVSRGASLPWPFDRYFRVAWYSQWRRSFVVGNAANRWAYPVDRPSDPVVIVQREQRHVMRYKMYDPLLPESDYEELAARGMDGFKFLSREQYDEASPDSPRGSLCPMDVALASGLSAGKHPLPVQHPVGGAILRMEDKRICLMHLSRQGLEEASAVRVRGGHVYAISFAAHPTEPILYYGTNHGHLVSVPVGGDRFGRQGKLAQLERLVSSIRVNSVGDRLYVGGLGQVMVIGFKDAKHEILVDAEIACGGLELFSDRWLLVNQGLHGFKIFDVSDDRLREEASAKAPSPIDLLVASPDGSHLLTIDKPPEHMSLHQVQYE